MTLSLSSTYLYRNVTSSKDDVATATVLDGTAIGTHTVAVSRLASASSFISGGFASETATAYVPTTQQSTDSYGAVTDTVLEEGETLTINYGNEDDPLTFTITGTAGGMTVEDLLSAVNDDPTTSQYVTASTYADDDGMHIQIKSDTGTTGEDGRVNVKGSEGVTSFTAPKEELSFTVGDGKIFTLSVPAEISLKNLAERINDADEQTPAHGNSHFYRHRRQPISTDS